MDAKLSKTPVSSAQFDDEGFTKTHQYAILTIVVPMDSTAQRNAVKDLLDVGKEEWCILDLVAKQPELPLEKPKSTQATNGFPDRKTAAAGD